MSDNPHDYKTLYEFETRSHTVYEAGPVTADTVRELLRDMASLLRAKPGMLLSDALDQAGDNVDNGHHFLCRYDLRQEVGRRLARHAAAINHAGHEATPLATVERALNPPKPVAAPVVAMDSVGA